MQRTLQRGLKVPEASAGTAVGGCRLSACHAGWKLTVIAAQTMATAPGYSPHGMCGLVRGLGTPFTRCVALSGCDTCILQATLGQPIAGY